MPPPSSFLLGLELGKEWSGVGGAGGKIDIKLSHCDLEMCICPRSSKNEQAAATLGQKHLCRTR